MIGTRGVPAAYGGFETAVEEVGRRLVERGHEVIVYTRGSERREREFLGMRVVHLPALPIKQTETLSHTGLSAVHAITGRRPDAAFVFNAANSPFLPALRARRIPVALHMDGLEWKRSKWGPRGKAYYRWAEENGVRWADALIADAPGIAEYYDDEFSVPTELIRYGAPILDTAAEDRLSELDLTPGGFHVVVARFEPENHVREIVEGYRASAATLPLVVVGSAPYAAGYIQQIHDAAAGDPRIRLVGGIYDQQLLDALYFSARTYLHGHSVGGTNPSLLRAMGAGTAVIAYDVGFNRETLGDTGWFFRDAAGVQRAVEDAEADAAAVSTAAQRVKERARRDFTWDAVAAEYEDLARRLAAGESVHEAAKKARRRRSTPSGAGTVVVAHPGSEMYGSDRVLIDSVAGIVDSGRDVVVVLPDSGPLAAALEAVGARVRVAPAFVLRKRLLRPSGWGEFARTFFGGSRAISRILREEQPEAVFVNTITLPLWPLRTPRRTPLVLHVHEGESTASRMMKKVLYFPARTADRILINSAFSRNVMLSAYPRLDGRTLTVLNAVPGPENPTSPRNELTGGMRLLFLGRLSPRKGADLIIEAVRLLRERGVEVSLDIVGSAFEGYEWYEQQLADMITTAGLQDAVTLHGFQPDVWEYLAASDVLVVPSRLDEPFGNTAVEGVLAERPVIVSDTSGLREATAGYPTAITVAPDSAAAIADAVEDAISRWGELVGQVDTARDLARERHSVTAYRDRIALALADASGSNRGQSDSE